MAEGCAGMVPPRRRQAAALALWRLRAPLPVLDTDPAWGVERPVVEALFEAAASAPGEESSRAYRQAVTELGIRTTGYRPRPGSGRAGGG